MGIYFEFMILWVFGKNQEVVKEKIFFFKRHFFEKYDAQKMNFEEFEIDDGLMLRKTYEYFNVQPFLAKMKMIVLSGVLHSKFDDSDIVEFKERLKNLPDDVLLVMTGIVSEADLKRRKMFKELEDLAHKPFYIFDKDEDFSSLIVSKLKILGVELNRNQVNLLRNVKSKIEAENLILQIAGLSDGGFVKNEDIYQLLSFDLDKMPFNVVDALMVGSLSKSVSSLNKARKSGVEDAQILLMLGNQLATAIAVKDALNEGLRADEIGKIMKLSGFVLNKMVKNQLHRDKLMEAFDFIFEAEKRIKVGELSYDQAVDACLVRLNA